MSSFSMLRIECDYAHRDPCDPKLKRQESLSLMQTNTNGAPLVQFDIVP